MRRLVCFASLLPFLVAACGEDAKELTCEERVNRASALIESALNQNLACQAADDCTTVRFKTQCSGGCNVAVAKSGETAVEDAISQANEEFCQDFAQHGCLYRLVDCSESLVLACDSNHQCVME